MQIAVRIDHCDERPLQFQLFDQIRSMILRGLLRSGEPLPASRILSQQVGVSRNTVILAYERLLLEGYVESRPSVGTFVSAGVPEASIFALKNPPPQAEIADAHEGREANAVRVPRSQQVVTPVKGLAYDFWVGRPSADSFPVREWRRLVDTKLRYAGARLTEYQDPQGLFELRRAIAEHVGPARGITVSPDEVVIVTGSQDGLNLVSSLLSFHTTAFVHEDPCYQGALYLFDNRAIRMIPVPVDEAGINTNELPSIDRALSYVTPSHQYPLGATLTLERRIRLLNWANETDSYIIEDDYDSDFRYEGAPLTALRGLDTKGRVFYLGTFSKCLGAGLRLGFVIIPPEFVAAARSWKTLMSNGSPWLEQASMAEFMETGAFNRHLRRIRQIYRSRRDALIRELAVHFGDVTILGSGGGMHIAWQLPPGFPPARTIEELGASIGVGAYSINSGGACIRPEHPRSDDTLVLGFANMSEDRIAAAIANLSRALDRARSHPQRNDPGRKVGP
jgi:GntR family transcriptional regulator/MocR family aminotransferase